MAISTSIRLAFAVPIASILSGCGGAPRDADRDDGGAPIVVASPDGTFDLQMPARWAGRYRIDLLSTPERGRGLPGAIVVRYLPTDTTIRPQALVAVVVYDSATWQEVAAEEGPPPGDSVAANRGKVYVVGLPQSNPFEPTSADAASFQRLELRPEEIRTLIRFR